jgi:hypothetical protein
MTNEELAEKINRFGVILAREYEILATQIQHDAATTQNPPLIQVQMLGVLWAATASMKTAGDELLRPNATRTTGTRGGSKTPLPKSTKTAGSKVNTATKIKTAKKSNSKRNSTPHKS